LRLGLNDGAYYLAGYAVECALKACIAKRTLRYDFPDRDLLQRLYIHDPNKLLQTARLVDEHRAHTAADPRFRVNWSVVERWSPDSRYNVHSREDGDALVKAIGDSRHGVMAWIKRFW
jgi:hypothetical protein